MEEIIEGLLAEAQYFETQAQSLESGGYPDSAGVSFGKATRLRETATRLREEAEEKSS